MNPTETKRCNKILTTPREIPDPFIATKATKHPQQSPSSSLTKVTNVKSTFTPKVKAPPLSHSTPTSPTKICKTSSPTYPSKSSSTSTSIGSNQNDDCIKTCKSESEPSSPRRKARVLLRQSALENSKESLSSDNLEHEHKTNINDDHHQHNLHEDKHLVRMSSKSGSSSSSGRCTAKGINITNIPNKGNTMIKMSKKYPMSAASSQVTSTTTNKVTIHNCVRNDNNNNYNTGHGMANTQTGPFVKGKTFNTRSSSSSGRSNGRKIMSNLNDVNNSKMKKVERQIKMIEIVEEHSKVVLTNVRRITKRDNYDKRGDNGNATGVRVDSQSLREQVVLKPLTVSSSPSSTNKKLSIPTQPLKPQEERRLLLPFSGNPIAPTNNVDKINTKNFHTQIASSKTITVNPTSFVREGHPCRKLINREASFLTENTLDEKKDEIKLNANKTSVNKSVFSKLCPADTKYRGKLSQITVSPYCASNYIEDRKIMDFKGKAMESSQNKFKICEVDNTEDKCLLRRKINLEEEGEQRDLVFIQPLEHNVEVLEGSDLELTVKIKGAKKVVWVKNDKIVPNIPPDFEYKSNSTDGTYGLRIRDAFIEDSGLYICEAYGSDEESDAITWCRVDVIDSLEDEINTSLEIEDIPIELEEPTPKRDFIVPVIITTSSDSADTLTPIMWQPTSPASEKRLIFRGVRDTSAESSRDVYEDAVENLERTEETLNNIVNEDRSGSSEQFVCEETICLDESDQVGQSDSIVVDESSGDDTVPIITTEDKTPPPTFNDDSNQNTTSKPITITDDKDPQSFDNDVAQDSTDLPVPISYLNTDVTETFQSSFLNEIDPENISFSPKSTSTELNRNISPGTEELSNSSSCSSQETTFSRKYDADETNYSTEMSLSMGKSEPDEPFEREERLHDFDPGVTNYSNGDMSFATINELTESIVEVPRRDETILSGDMSLDTTIKSVIVLTDKEIVDDPETTQYSADMSFSTISEVVEVEENDVSLPLIKEESSVQHHSKSFTSQSSTESAESDTFRSSSIGERMSSIESPNGTCGSGGSLSLNLSASENRPKIIMGTSNLIAIIGEDVNLRVKIQATDEANTSVRWWKFVRGAYQRVEISDEENSHIQMNRVNSELIALKIKNVNYEDSGKYRVKVQNLHGTDCHDCILSVEGPPEPPSTPPAAHYEENSNSILISWSSCTYDGGSAVTGYCLEASSSPLDAKTDTWKLVTPPSFKWLCFSLPNPSSSLKYKFRVSVQNAYGTGKPSSPSVELVVPIHSESTLDEADGSRYPNRKISTSRDDGPDSVSYEYKDVRLKNEPLLEYYDKFEQLGKGRFGVVFKVTNKATKKSYAGKFVKCIKAKDKERAQLECKIMNELKYHPKLICLVDAFEMPREIAIVTEMINGGELFERVVADDFTLTEHDCITFLRQICNGVKYIHENNIMHLDLKPENILCTTKTSNQIKIIDFGLAQYYNPKEPISVLFGTAEFVSPEIINYDTICPATDMWSIGVITYILLSGLSPFLGDNDNETFSNITRGEFDFEDEAFEQISEDAKDFISSLILKRKEKRLTAAQCLEHTWLALSDAEKKDVVLPTDKLKRFLVRRKWQKTGNAIRALGRITTLYSSRRSSSASSSNSTSASPLGSSLDKSLLTQGSTDYDSVFGSVDVPTSPEGHHVNKPLNNLPHTNSTMSKTPKETLTFSKDTCCQDEDTSNRAKYNGNSRSDSGICDVVSVSSTSASNE